MLKLKRRGQKHCEKILDNSGLLDSIADHVGPELYSKGLIASVAVSLEAAVYQMGFLLKASL